MSAGCARRLLATFGVALTAALTTAGLLVVYNAQQDRQRAVEICEQVSELRTDIVMFLEARDLKVSDVDAFRPVSCPS